MYTSVNQPDQLRQRIAALETELSTTEAEAAPLHNRLLAVNAVIDNAPAEEIRHQFSHVELRRIREAKSMAYSERAELNTRIQDVGHRISNIKSLIYTIRRDLQRAEYEAVPASTLHGELAEHIAAIREVESEQDDLTFERDTLQCKRLEAQQTSTTVDIAERELQAARDAYNQTQGEAFISDKNVDLSAHVDRIEKAEKHLAAVTKNAAAGRSALPRISARLAAIEGERTGLDSQRNALLAEYWRTRKQIIEAEYRDAVQQTIEAGRRLAALDNKTRGRFGHDLIKSLREGLKQPVNGKSLEPVKIVDHDFADILAEFESELSARLSKSHQ